MRIQIITPIALYDPSKPLFKKSGAMDVFELHKLSICTFIFDYTGWPRENATTSIINFKDIVNKTDLFFI